MRRLQILGVILLVASAAAAIVVLQHQPPALTNLPKPPLKELASTHSVAVGNFAIRNHIYEPAYSGILTSEFDFALADNTPNWYFTDGGLRPSATTYNFKQMDEIVSYAEQHNMPVQAHHYVWGEEKWLPDWLKKGNYAPGQLMEILHNHIATVGEHYRGRIREWTVVNEAFSRNQHIYGLHDWWADATGGTNYIDQAFIWARQADPNSKLILNDFKNEDINEISDAMHNYIKEAKQRGVPIDGIGMQMHIDGTHPPQKDEVISNMKRFGELGVEVYITELDVNMNDVQAESDDKNAIQANIYYEMARACIESKVCHSFAILGVSDEETWYNHVGLADPRPLPFDQNYKPKPAYFSLRDAFQQQ